jgi:hypothetical protein
LGISLAPVTAQAADADYFGCMVGFKNIMTDAGQQWTSWKNPIRTGATPPLPLSYRHYCRLCRQWMEQRSCNHHRRLS